MPKIYLIDVTNRDGVQTAKLGLSKLEKTIINIFLDEMGIFQSEFGFPTTKHESNYLQANLELAKLGVLKHMRLEGWIRAMVADVELAYKLVPGLEHLNLSISTSDQMIQGKFQGRKNRDDIIHDMAEAVEAAKAHGTKTIGVNAEDASRTDLDYLIKFGKAAKEHGACRLRYCDTLGYDNPFSIYDTAKALAENVCLPIELHCHGDLGMAVATSISGAKGVIDGGQDAYINTTVNGIGERCGNADLVATILAITKSKGFGEKYQLGNHTDLSKAYKIAKFASYAFHVPIPINPVSAPMPLPMNRASMPTACLKTRRTMSSMVLKNSAGETPTWWKPAGKSAPVNTAVFQDSVISWGKWLFRLRTGMKPTGFLNW